jgi:hypothetical protein
MCYLSQTLMLNRGLFVEQRVMHSYSFRCDKIHSCLCYDSSPPLLCYFSTANPPQTHRDPMAQDSIHLTSTTHSVPEQQEVQL